jgi:hypothetical protein
MKGRTLKKQRIIVESETVRDLWYYALKQARQMVLAEFKGENAFEFEYDSDR